MSNNPIPWIGLTGGIACGKSAAGNLFAKLGIAVIDADQVSRDVVTPGRPELRQIVEFFGEDFLTEGGELNRAKMRQHVFSDPNQRTALEAILHPAIHKELVKQCAAAESHSAYVIAMVPILEKLGIKDRLTRIAVVDAAEDTQLLRLCQRDNMTEDAAQAMINAQPNRKTRLESADDIIKNNNSIYDLQSQINHLHQKYLQLK